ncbi:MAG: hypothetical protein WAV56_04495 [Microgenomates group bacterium]
MESPNEGKPSQESTDNESESPIEAKKKLEDRFKRGIEGGEVKLQPEIVKLVPVATVTMMIENEGNFFLLREAQRTTLQDKNPENDEMTSASDYFEGRLLPILNKPVRKYDHPISAAETTRAFKDLSEMPREAAIRGLKEELFGFPEEDEEKEMSPEELRLSNFLREKLEDGYFAINDRGPYDENGDWGVRSRVEECNYLLILGREEIEEYNLPIAFDKDGFPKDLYEETRRPNKLYLNHFEWEEISLADFEKIREDSKSMIIKYRDINGQEREVGVMAKNAFDVLKAIIEFGGDDETYIARKRLLELSEGTVHSWQAFTTNFDELGLDPVEKIVEIMTYLDRPDTWLKERQKLHEDIIKTEQEHVIYLSRNLNKSSRGTERLSEIFNIEAEGNAPTTYAQIGTLGSEMFLSEKMRACCGITLDTTKGTIRTAVYIRNLRQELMVTDAQLKIEATYLTNKIESWAISSEQLSVITEGLYLDPAELKNLAGSKRIEIIDDDISLEETLLRTLIDETSTKLDFNELSNRHREIRFRRNKLIKEIQTGARVYDNINYHLISTEGGYVTRILNITDRKMQEFSEDGPNMLELSRRSTNADVSEEVKDLRRTIITDRYINSVTNRYPYLNEKNMIKVLQKYKNKSLKVAIDELSSEKVR